VVGVQTRVEDLVHPADHDPHKKAGYLLGLLCGALDDQLVVDGVAEALGVEPKELMKGEE
jgi:hypothetical protein